MATERQKYKRTFWVRRGVIIIAFLLLISSAFIWIFQGITFGYWSGIVSIIFAVIGIIVTSLQWFLPISPAPLNLPETHDHPQDVSQSVTVQSKVAPLSTKPLLEQQSQFPILWNVPYRRNPFFTGREYLLAQLHGNLMNSKYATLTQAQAMSGLGGIGKTQIAIEYAYRYRNEYRFIFWVGAATRDTLMADFVAIAGLLEMPERNEQDQNMTVASVKRWLATHEHWLLILDNADDLDLVYEFLPIEGSGHLLLTTRAQAVGPIAQSIEVEKMTIEEGILFLLRRAKVLGLDAPLHGTSQKERVAAEKIVIAMDGLPLALDQAGAYIEETGCSLEAYLDQYWQRQLTLLSRRGRSSFGHPEPVATTWALSFGWIEQMNPPAGDLLRFCAFLDPDAIPEELIVEGATELGPLLQPVTTDSSLLDEAIQVLRRFSLIRRYRDDKTLSIHHLVQTVFKASMSGEEQQLWAERTVQATNKAFPKEIDITTWSQCQRLLPHALACAVLIKQYAFAFPEAAQLVYQAAYYLHDHAQYLEAEPLYQRALTIREQVLGPEHPDTATSLDTLARLYEARGHYERAEPLMERALVIREQVLGPQHPDTAKSIHHLARLYHAWGQYERAEPLYQRALAIREQVLGPDHPYTALSLNTLAELYQAQGRYEQAEPLYQRALAIRERALGSDHPYTALSLNTLASLYQAQGKYAQAEPLYQKALAIREKVWGLHHPETAMSLNNLALLYQIQGQYERAEPLYQRALAIREQVLGPDHPYTALSLNTLAELYQAQGRYEQAEPLYQRSLAIRRQRLGPEHPYTAISLNALAQLYEDLGQYERAEPLYQRALAIKQKMLGLQHPDTATTLNNLAELYTQQGKYEQAEALYKQALQIRETVLGTQHPATATTLDNLAELYTQQGKYEQAEALYQRCLAIWEKELGPQHPNTVKVLENYAHLLREMKREAAAAALEVRVKDLQAE